MFALVESHQNKNLEKTGFSEEESSWAVVELFCGERGVPEMDDIDVIKSSGSRERF
jgi:hypothetical protein